MEENSVIYEVGNTSDLSEAMDWDSNQFANIAIRAKSKISKRLDNLQGRTPLKQQIQRLTMNISALDLQQHEWKSEVEDLNLLLDNRTQVIGVLSTNLKSQEEVIVELHAANAEYQSEIKRLKQELVKSNIISKLKGHKTETELEQKLSLSQFAYNELSKEFSKFQHNLAFVEKKLKYKSDTIQKKKLDHSKYQKDVSVCYDKLTAQIETIEDMFYAEKIITRNYEVITQLSSTHGNMEGLKQLLAPPEQKSDQKDNQQLRQKLSEEVEDDLPTEQGNQSKIEEIIAQMKSENESQASEITQKNSMTANIPYTPSFGIKTSSKSEDMEGLKLQLASLQQKNEEKDAEIQKLNLDHSKYEDDVSVCYDKLTVEIEAIENMLDAEQFMNRNHKVIAQLSSIHGNMEGLQLLLASPEQKSDQSDNQQLRQRKEMLPAEQGYHSKITKIFERMEYENASQESTITQVNSMIGNIPEDMEGLKQQLASLKQKSEEKDAEIQKLKLEHSKYEKDVSVCYDKLTVEIEAMEDTLEAEKAIRRNIAVIAQLSSEHGNHCDIVKIIERMKYENTFHESKITQMKTSQGHQLSLFKASL
uniref:Uncharacterized protein n=1 Tax=Knipowitschia caucasica TaxID=637954 RepID=A0AAV2KLQ8_KNICA